MIVEAWVSFLDVLVGRVVESRGLPAWSAQRPHLRTGKTSETQQHCVDVDTWNGILPSAVVVGFMRHRVSHESNPFHPACRCEHTKPDPLAWSVEDHWRTTACLR